MPINFDKINFHDVILALGDDYSSDSTKAWGMGVHSPDSTCKGSPTTEKEFLENFCRLDENNSWKLATNANRGHTWAQIEAKHAELESQWDADAYKRNRQSEYPTITELTVALYDEDDKAALETQRAAVKKKWPKDNSGPK